MDDSGKSDSILGGAAIQELLKRDSAVEEELKAIREVEVEAEKILEVLGKIELLRGDPNFRDYVEATEKFLSGIK